jgi:hypothetical protein
VIGARGRGGARLAFPCAIRVQDRARRLRDAGAMNFMRIPFPAGLVAVSIALTAAAADARADALSEALAPVFQADQPAALAHLRALTPDALDGQQAAVRDCVVDRFLHDARPSPDRALPADLAAVLDAYRAYWTATLMHREPPSQAQAALSRALGRWLPDAPADLDARTDAAIQLAERHGWHALGGVTEPLREFMLWRSQASHLDWVALPGGAVDVRVTTLDGFASLGWGAWGTCDRSHTGGWTTDAGLMVVAASWDVSSESYRVSLLAHEAQHFADRARWPALAQPDLEYRAKLVELALARHTLRALLDAFAAGARRDRTLPHPFAEWWVMDAIGARLGTKDPGTWPADRVRAAALAALAAHDSALLARGAKGATSVLPD